MCFFCPIFSRHIAPFRRSCIKRTVGMSLASEGPAGAGVLRMSVSLNYNTDEYSAVYNIKSVYMMLEVCMSILYIHIYVYVYRCMYECICIYMCLFVVMHAMPCHVYIACMHIIYIYICKTGRIKLHTNPRNRPWEQGPYQFQMGLFF